MRWMKHLSTAQSDEKMALILAEHGPWGYGCFWLVLETIAQVVDEEDRTFICLPEPIWRKKLGISSKKLTEIFSFFQKIGIFRVFFEKKGEKKSEILITVDSPNILKYRDEYSNKKRRNSGVTPESLRSKETETESELEAGQHTTTEVVRRDDVSTAEPEPNEQRCDQDLPEAEKIQSPPDPDIRKPQKPPEKPPDKPLTAAALGFEILAILGQNAEDWAVKMRRFDQIRSWWNAGYSSDEIREVFRLKSADFRGIDNPFAYAGKRQDGGRSMMDDAVETLRESKVKRCGSVASGAVVDGPTDTEKQHPLWGLLGPKLKPNDFRAFIAPCRAIKGDQGWEISVRSQFAADWIENRLGVNLRSVIGQYSIRVEAEKKVKRIMA